MRNVMTIKNIDNEIIDIEVLVGFKIESIGKEYIAYTVNDDCVSDEVNVLISEIKYNNEVPEIVPIKDDEKEMVLMFYDKVRKAE